jgi:Uma2 family endonuclease
MTIADVTTQDRETDSAATNEPVHRFLFENVSWEYYTQTLRELDRSGQRARVTYDRGRMELMMLGRRYEIIKTVIGRLIEAYGDEIGPGVEGVGSVTCRRADLERGLEPDECYYVTTEYCGPDDHLDLDNNPPPDLAIEVEVSTEIGTRIDIYGELGVPEVWRFDGALVQVLELAGGAYRPVERSRCFPNLDLEEFSRYLVRAIKNQRTVPLEYRELLRSRKGQTKQ